jgi:prolyl oligopeptidase
MPSVIAAPPPSPVEAVTEVIHGVAVTDPYRWLEDQHASRTRQWIGEQTKYARSYLDNIAGRQRIRERIRQFLAVESYDSFLKAGSRYFFSKRLPNEEQPSIYLREGTGGADQLLIDPSSGGNGKYTAVRPLHVSTDGTLLLYQTKQGGERTATFSVFDIQTRTTFPDTLGRGYLRGFVFAADGRGYYYVHESAEAARPFYRAAYYHALGTSFAEDREIFSAGEDPKLRLCLISDSARLGFLVHRFGLGLRTGFYLATLGSISAPQMILSEADYTFGPRLVAGRILALTDRYAPNLRIVEVRPRPDREPEWIEIVPEVEQRIEQWTVAGDRILVSYFRKAETRVSVFGLEGQKKNEWPARTGGRTVRFLAASAEGDDVIIETESFTKPPSTLVCSAATDRFDLWAERKTPLHHGDYRDKQTSYRSRDGVEIPIFLLGRRDVLQTGRHPAIMTSYGGWGVSMTPRFSVFVAFLVERGCLFALPNIRGGSEFGAAWHEAAKGRNRQKAYDDFLAAAEWLVSTGLTSPDKLAIFGGSNSGLLVGAALTQRPELFAAAVAMVPLFDMLRYHLFDQAYVWRDELGTSEDRDDFSALLRYSPYHQVRSDTPYPPTLIVSGDADQNCNPLHARKMTARLQANSSRHPILLDYSAFRGHSPVLPLSDRIEALTDRMAFLCDQLGLTV